MGETTNSNGDCGERVHLTPTSPLPLSALYSATAAKAPFSRPVTRLSRTPSHAASVGTVHDWEQARVVPDRPAQALLRVIEAEPETVRRVLEGA